MYKNCDEEKAKERDLEMEKVKSDMEKLKTDRVNEAK